MKPVWILTVMMILKALGGWSQCPISSFTLSSNSVCSNQVILSANSSSAGSYNWDFCAGDLSKVPSAAIQYGLSGATGRPGIDFAFNGNNWIGFVTGTYTNSLFRIFFGNGLDKAPTFIEDLSVAVGGLSSPGQVRIIQEGTQWYALVHNTGTGELLKLSFGADLSAPTFTKTVIFSGIGGLNSGFAMGRDPVQGWICVISDVANQIKVIRLGVGLATPGPSDIVSTSSLPNANNLGDVDLINQCGTWYGYVDNLGNGIVYRLRFGSNLFSVPAVDQIASLSLSNPGRLRIGLEAGQYYLFVVALDGRIIKLSFGTDPASTPALTDEGNIDGVLPSNIYGLAVARQNSVWAIHTIDQSNGNVYAIRYPDQCSASLMTSQLVSPEVSYQQSGVYTVALSVTNASGTSFSTATVNVSGLFSPDVSFNSQSVCANNNVNFYTVNSSGDIMAYAWDFGDSGSSVAANPTHVYTSAATYSVQLTVTSSNTCINTARQSIQIHNPPLANFSLPVASPVCTNDAYSLNNTSTFDPGSNPTWEWRLNGNLISTQKDLVTSFSSPTAQQISLKAFIPGCNTESIQNIPMVLTGPTVGFNVTDDCIGNTVAFQNVTTGADAGYLWNFGDGSTSTQTNPGHLYTTAANYNVTLTASNSLGCQIATTKPLKISSLPQPNFSIGLPPFSCANSATPFQNNTPPLTDSNITAWNWSFGDPLGGVSSSMTPSYTYTAPGNYSVQLTATSDAGCIGTQTRLITIASSPTADFTFGPTCINQISRFSDQSSGGVQSRVWQINSSTFTTTNPTYTFSSAGTFPAMLTVTGSNGCANVNSKSVFVPQAPTGNFTLTNPCAGQPTQFTDASVTYGDVVTGWNWNFAGNSIGGNPANYVFSLPGNYNVKMTTTYASGCQYTTSKTIAVNPTPVAAFTATPDRGSAPLTVQFNNQSTGATSYLWTFFDKVPSSSTRYSEVYTYSSSIGTYSAQLKASNAQGCSDTKSVPIIILNPLIDLVLSDIGLVTDPVSGKLKCKVSILNNSNIPFYGAEVALFLSDKAVVNENLQFAIQPGESTTQTLSFTFSATQSDLSYICAEILLEKDAQQDNNKRCLGLDHATYFFDPYPNPTSGTVRIDWVEEGPGTAVISVYDNQGKRAYRWETLSKEGLNQTVHDLSFLTSGLYVVIVETSQSRKVMRFVRQ